MKQEIPENKHLKRFEDYLLARGRKSSGRYLQVAQQFLKANPGELEPFEAHHVNRFLANLSRGGAGGEVPFAIWRMPPAGENQSAMDRITIGMIRLQHTTILQQRSRAIYR